MTKNILVSFRFKSIAKPVLEISDNGVNQAIIRLIPYADEHITIHLRNDGSLLRTQSSVNKPKSVWDETNIEIA